MSHPEKDAAPLAGGTDAETLNSPKHDTQVPALIEAELLRRFRARQDLAAAARIVRAEQNGELLEARWLRCERARARARGRWNNGQH